MNYRGHSAGLSPAIRVVVSWLTWLLVGVLVVAPNLAGASPFAHKITFTASGFDPGAPQDPVSGSFTITYDPLVQVFGEPIDAIDLVVAGHTFTLAGVVFDYSPQRPHAPRAMLYLSMPPPGGTVPGTNDFELAAHIDSSGNLDAFFVYALEISDRAWGAVAIGSVTGSPPQPPGPSVPEPATLPLLLTALVSVWLVSRVQVSSKM
jgi:hypothetical protein